MCYAHSKYGTMSSECANHIQNMAMCHILNVISTFKCDKACFECAQHFQNMTKRHILNMLSAFKMQ